MKSKVDNLVFRNIELRTPDRACNVYNLDLTHALLERDLGIELYRCGRLGGKY